MVGVAAAAAAAAARLLQRLQLRERQVWRRHVWRGAGAGHLRRHLLLQAQRQSLRRL